MIITTEKPRHEAAIELLLDQAFGADRAGKSAYRLREGVEPLSELCLVALEHDDFGHEVLEGTIRYWPVMIGGTTPAVLLGPIAVTPRWRRGGLGSKLIRMTLNKAAAAGHRIVVLIGDAPYYERFGFSRSLTLGLDFPGPVDHARFLGMELVDGALTGVTGMVGMADPAVREDAFRPPPSDLRAGGVWHARPA